MLRTEHRGLVRCGSEEKNSCSLCSKPFVHGSVTFLGRADDGAMQVVSECCSRKLHLLLGGGVFLVPGMSTRGA
jgi:hypothetical protein